MSVADYIWKMLADKSVCVMGAKGITFDLLAENETLKQLQTSF